jgi:hypothetical protein
MKDMNVRVTEDKDNIGTRIMKTFVNCMLKSSQAEWSITRETFSLFIHFEYFKSFRTVTVDLILMIPAGKSHLRR